MGQQTPVLGLDFGGVIQGGPTSDGAEDTTFLSGSFEEAMATPPVAGAFQSIASLSSVFAGHVYIVSKCGPRIQERTEHWLAQHRFFETTGIDPTHLRFCRQRAEKADHCAELAVTHFVDDRADVLELLSGVVEHRYLFGRRGEHVPAGTARVHDWQETERAIRGAVDARARIVGQHG